MKINNTRALHSYNISSSVIYFICIPHSGSFPIIYNPSNKPEYIP